MADQKLHACANFPIQARLSFARRTREFFVTNDKKYQTCLIFGLHVTNDENAVNVARTRGYFVARQVRSCAAGIMPTKALRPTQSLVRPLFNKFIPFYITTIQWHIIRIFYSKYLNPRQNRRNCARTPRE